MPYSELPTAGILPRNELLAARGCLGGVSVANTCISNVHGSLLTAFWFVLGGFVGVSEVVFVDQVAPAVGSRSAMAINNSAHGNPRDAMASGLWLQACEMHTRVSKGQPERCHDIAAAHVLT